MPTTTSFSAEHILLKDRVFNDTVRGLHPLNINVILNGNENWNTEVNVVLFRAMHRYIHTSKRF